MKSAILGRAAIGCALLGSVADAVFIQPRGCVQNNCLRALAHQDRQSTAYGFCTSFLSASWPATASTGIPAFLSNCAPDYVPKLSAACPCFLATATYLPPAGTLSSTSVPSVSATSTGSGSSGTTTTSSSTSSSSIISSTTSSVSTPSPSTPLCPPALPSTITVTAPPDTTSCPLPTTAVSVSISTTTITETAPTTPCPPPSTVTSISVSTTQTTVTSQVPLPSTCSQPLANSGLENPNRDLHPWQAANGGTASVFENGLTEACPSGVTGPQCPPGGIHGGQVAFFLRVRGGGAGTNAAFLRLWQGFTPCVLSTRYQPRMWVASNTGLTTYTFTMRIYGTHVDNLGASSLVATLVRTVTEITTWREVVFDTFTMPAFVGALVTLDIKADTGDYTLFFDDITMPSA